MAERQALNLCRSGFKSLVAHHAGVKGIGIPRVYTEIMRNDAVFREALRLLDGGKNAHQVADELGVPWGTVRYWKAGRRSQTRVTATERCALQGCPWLPPRDGAAYAYLLGLYLGDGTIQKVNRSIHLRIFLDDRYPGIQDECASAIVSLADGGAASRTQREGCTVVGSYSHHWKCVFPQHGPGVKHTRAIELVDWQQVLADEHPGSLLRGLIHSDGCRYMNTVKGREYPTYSFANKSGDIHTIFRRAASRLGIRYTAQPFVTSVARRPEVAKMDAIVGPKY
jgi:hypothetical protein